MSTHTTHCFTAADLTLYLVERAGGADEGGESRLALGLDAVDREAQDIGAGRGDTVTVTPLAWDSDDERFALCDVDDIDYVLADVFAPGRCDTYTVLRGLRERVA